MHGAERMEDKERVVRRTLPSHTFTLKMANMRFLKAEVERRGVRGPSEALREILDEVEAAKQSTTESEAA
jgi:hypothetical protein